MKITIYATKEEGGKKCLYGILMFFVNYDCMQNFGIIKDLPKCLKLDETVIRKPQFVSAVFHVGKFEYNHTIFCLKVVNIVGLLNGILWTM